MIEIIFFFGILVIVYIWGGYPLLLVLISKFKSNHVIEEGSFLPKATLLIAVHNEEDVVRQKIENSLSLDYPKESLEIIIASDGSTDKTVEISKYYDNRGIKVIDFKKNRGKALVHNDVVKEALGEIIVFSDVDTQFKKDTLKCIVDPFLDPSVGCATGNLIYLPYNKSSISSAESFYWRFEKQLRKLESNVGILATASGACMAIRKGSWRDLSPIDDSDFTTPLDVVLQGYKVVFAKNAIAYDIPPQSVKGEFNARIRMTSKNLIGTLKRWGLKGWIRYPLVSWGLLSHKILRWFTPFFMISVLITSVFLLNKGWIYQLIFTGQLLFYSIALVGFIGELGGKRIPLASAIFSFCVANLGMGIGVIKGLLGKAPASYKMSE